MDTITHMALGAIIGEAVLGKQAGKRALSAGAIAQVFPDIDVIASVWLSPIDNLLVHRGITHSFLFGAIVALPLAFAAQRGLSLRQPSIKLFLFFCLQIWLHDVLDTCNAYGTGLLEPFNQQRFSFHLLFVADPLFSISLVIAFLALTISSKNSSARKKWIVIGLFPCCMYFIYACFNKVSISSKVKKALTYQHIPHTEVLITPTPFNSLLWNVIAAGDSGYHIGYHSVFDKNNSTVPYNYFPKKDHLLKGIPATVDVDHLIRFADNFYTVDKLGDTLVFNVLRFGQILGWQEPKAQSAFQYLLNPGYDNTLVMQRGRFKGWSVQTLSNMFRRIKGR